MILIDEILISEDVIKKNFACNLSACKGACCVEGDYGAPLTEKEQLILAEVLVKVMPYLPENAKAVIQEKGFAVKNDIDAKLETELMPDGSCVFMGRNQLGITFCGIEKAFNAGDIDFKKPISCHLYPIRVTNNDITGFHSLNYDRWDICSAACDRGDKEEIRVYEFAKDAIIRQYGEEFYDQLSAAADNYEKAKM